MSLVKNLKEHKTIIPLILSVLIISACLLIILYLRSDASKEQENTLIIKTTKEDIEIKIETADTASERSRGLMYRDSLCESCGMLFILDSEMITSFWMKNTYISLDIIFIDSNMQIVHIAKNTKTNQIEKTYSSVYPVKYVLEVNANFCLNNGIEIGDNLEL